MMSKSLYPRSVDERLQQRQLANGRHRVLAGVWHVVNLAGRRVEKVFARVAVRGITQQLEDVLGEGGTA